MQHFQNQRSNERHNVARSALEMRSDLENMLRASRVHPDPVVVRKYDFATQTVEVMFKDRPELPPYPGVRIWGPGGEARAYRPLKSIEGDGEGDVGLLIWMMGRGTDKTFSDATQSPQPVADLPVFPVFIPGWPLSDQAQPAILDAAGDSNLNKLGPSDAAFVFFAGTNDEISIVAKRTGELIIRANVVYVVKNADLVADAKAVELDGTVSVSTAIKVT